MLTQDTASIDLTYHSEKGEVGAVNSERAMRFRLLYSGEMFGASRNETRSFHKHEIRKALSPQLKRLWSEQAALKQLAERIGSPDGG